MTIIGTRGATGKKTVNAATMANEHFEIEVNLTVDKVVKEDPKENNFMDLFE